MQHPIRPFSLGLSIALLGALLGLSCTAALERSTEKIVAQGLEAVNKPGNRGQVKDLLSSDEIQEATRKLTGVVLETAVDDLEGDALRERIHQIAMGFVEDVTPALAAAFDEEVWPEIRDKLEESLALAVDQVLSEETLARLRAFAGDTAAEVIRQTAPELVESISAGVSKGIEDAFETVLAELLPVLEDTLDRDHGPAARELARSVAHGALLGVADALNEEAVNEVFDRERDEILARLERSTARTAWRLKWGIAALGLGFVVAVALLLWIWRRHRQREAAFGRLERQLGRQQADGG